MAKISELEVRFFSDLSLKLSLAHKKTYSA